MKHPLAKISLPSLLLLVVVLLIQTPTTTLAQNTTSIDFLDCPNSSENFTAGSQFQSNLLNLLFPSLVTSGSLNGFFKTTSGYDPDTVYGLAQCRGDATMDECRACLTIATVLISQNCINKKDATIRFDYCMLRYSSISFFSKMDYQPTTRWYWTPNVTDDVIAYNKQLAVLMSYLTSSASTKPSKYDQGWISYTDFNKIYGLVQCTQDLSSSDCSSCLQTMISIIPRCCNGRSGGLVVSPSCLIWYRKDIQFFRSLSLPPPPPSLTPSRPSPPPPLPTTLPPPPPELPTTLPPPPPPTEIPVIIGPYVPSLPSPPSPSSHDRITMAPSKYTIMSVFVFFVLLMK